LEDPKKQDPEPAAMLLQATWRGVPGGRYVQGGMGASSLTWAALHRWRSR
jgi:hypothetical protein